MYPFHYQEYGKGQTVILLHGFAESSNIWTELISELDNQFHLLAIDLPGFGKTPIYKSEFQLIEIGVLLNDFLAEKKITQYHLVGHSLGGYISLAMASLNPKAVKSLVLFHSTAMADSEEKIHTRNKVSVFIKKYGPLPFLETFIPSLFNRPKQNWINELLLEAKGIKPETLIAYTLAMRERPSYLDLIAELTCKVMLIAGAKDQLIPLVTLENQAKTLQKPHFLRLEEAGHMGMLELPDICGKTLKDFFNAE
jgi:pimeloyl-ACP methyl ester carboxylesterase